MLRKLVLRRRAARALQIAEKQKKENEKRDRERINALVEVLDYLWDLRWLGGSNGGWYRYMV